MPSEQLSSVAPINWYPDAGCPARNPEDIVECPQGVMCACWRCPRCETTQPEGTLCCDCYSEDELR